MPASQVVSPAAGLAVGELVHVDSLASVQRERYSRPTVLAAQAVGGEEDIPEVCIWFLEQSETKTSDVPSTVDPRNGRCVDYMEEAHHTLRACHGVHMVLAVLPQRVVTMVAYATAQHRQTSEMRSMAIAN